MNQSAVGWIALAVAIVVFFDVLFVELRRIVREGKRLVDRVGAYADLPIFAQVEATLAKVERTARAIDGMPVVVERGRVALGTIRNPRNPPVFRAPLARPPVDAWDEADDVDPYVLDD